MAPGNICKVTPKNTHVCAFWKQVLDNSVFTFIFRIWGGGHGTVTSPLRTLVCLYHCVNRLSGCLPFSYMRNPVARKISNTYPSTSTTNQTIRQLRMGIPSTWIDQLSRRTHTKFLKKVFYSFLLLYNGEEQLRLNDGETGLQQFGYAVLATGRFSDGGLKYFMRKKCVSEIQ